MKINVTLPFDATEYADEFFTAEAVAEISRHAEKLGFHAGNVTDHPCPTARWRDAGGHDAQDPFVLLSLVAAATRTFRLQTGILVATYRNPFITARAVSTLDVFSSGRLTLGLGAGYMKGEFFALGAGFDQRNDLFDEYLKAMKLAWTGEAFDFEGTGYSARGSRMRPAPIQKPHPPLLIGGNSNRAIRRAVELGDGWNPFFTGHAPGSTTRTRSMSGQADVVAGVNYMLEYCEKIGREEPPFVWLSSIMAPGDTWEAQAVLDRIGAYADLGVAGAATHFAGSTRAEWCDNAERFASDVLAKL
jgi:probable F420-dependent oxidoreductase